MFFCNSGINGSESFHGVRIASMIRRNKECNTVDCVHFLFFWSSPAIVYCTICCCIMLVIIKKEESIRKRIAQFLINV
jgi:hypothetical protein